MAIRVCEVSKSFGEKHVLDSVSFEVKTSEILFILGKSGMGKSVILKQIIGLLEPDSGNIYVDEDWVNSPQKNRLEQIRKKCGMVFQQPALLDSLTVFDNIAFGLKANQDDSSDIRKKVAEKAELVELPSRVLSLYPAEVSYGMQKRASLARTLCTEPQYLLFDEPTTGLDPVVTHTINSLIESLSRKLNVTCVVVSHDMGCALKIAHRILFLDQAKVLAVGSVPEILGKYRQESPLIQDFFEETLSLLSPQDKERLNL